MGVTVVKTQKRIAVLLLYVVAMLAAVAIAAGGCGGGSGRSSTTGATSTGSVSGYAYAPISGTARVANAPAGCTPLESATVTCGGISAATDSDGYYILAGVPTGASQTVTISKSGYNSTTAIVTVTAGQTSVATAENSYDGLLTLASGGSISITSSPSGALIYIDSVSTGLFTPQTLSGISAGQHTISMSLFGYAPPAAQIVTVTTGQTVSASFTFTITASENSTDISPFGICALVNRQVWNAERYPTALQLANEAGMRITREDFGWESIETAKGVYDQEFLDLLDTGLEKAMSQGFTVYGLIAYSNPWSTGSNAAPSTAAQRQDFADYVTFLVDRYKGVIDYWEIWNEPESSEFWKPEPDYADYFELLKVAYAAAKAANPDAKILSAGSGHEEMIEELFGMGMNDYIDILAIHPYTYPQPIEQSFWETAVNDFNTLSGGKPIWVTEIGVPTHTGTTGSTEAMQAIFLPRIHMYLLRLNMQHITWYDMVDDGTDITEREDNFGLMRTDYSIKPAYYTYKYMANMLDGKTLAQDFGSTDDMAMALLFSETGEKTLALWSYDETLDSNNQVTGVTDKDFTISITGTVTSITDIFGETSTAVSESGGSITGTVSNSPIYVTGDFTVNSVSVE